MNAGAFFAGAAPLEGEGDALDDGENRLTSFDAGYPFCSGFTTTAMSHSRSMS